MVAENPAANGVCRLFVVHDPGAPGPSAGEILIGGGHFVSEAGDVSNVLAKLQGDEFDLLVLDVSPPDTAIALLDQIEHLPPVLLMSDTSEFSLADLRISAFLRKPFSPNVLLDMVSRFGRNHRPGDSLFLA